MFNLIDQITVEQNIIFITLIFKPSPSSLENCITFSVRKGRFKNDKRNKVSLMLNLSGKY